MLPIIKRARYPEEIGRAVERDGGEHIAPVNPVRHGDVYVSPITVGDQDFHVVIDTGSSDTWLVGEELDCRSMTDNAHISRSRCGFGPSYRKSSTYQHVADEGFHVKYADGEFLKGGVGRENITFAGVSVVDQAMGVANQAAWMGDDKSSGLVGLAYPKAMSVNGAADPTKRTPLFTTMWQQGAIPPIFSLGVGSDSEDGILAFGGIPADTSKYSSKWVKVPIEITNAKNKGVNGAPFQGEPKHNPEYSMYTLTTGGISVSSHKNMVRSLADLIWGQIRKDNMQFIVDSGTTLNYLPVHMAQEVNEAFDPPATKEGNNWFVNCDAIPPKFGVHIGGHKFFVNPVDMMRHQKPGVKKCLSTVQETHGYNILGDAWLKNVLVVFDIGAGEMKLAAKL